MMRVLLRFSRQIMSLDNIITVKALMTNLESCEDDMFLTGDANDY